MFTIRNLGGIALLLAGSTWIWTTPAFAGPGVSTSGVMWGLSQALSLLTVAGFCVATWGLFTRHAWWETAAVGSAVVGLVAVVVFWIAAYAGGENVGAATWNAFVHVLIVGGILALLLAPRLEQWVNQHVMAR
jgi:hypothetical protein